MKNSRLEACVDAYPSIIAEIRGKGLLIGVALKVPNRDFMARAREEKLLLAAGGDNIVRLLPALKITGHEAAEALGRFENTCRAMQRETGE